MRAIKFSNVGLIATLLLLVGVARGQTPVGTAFTYQGSLENAGVPVTDTCDFEFGLFEDSSGLSQVGATLSESQVDVDDGLFTVRLDFGSGVFDGDARWLEVAVQCSGDPGFTPLSPLQEIAPAPYALALPGLRTQQDPTCASLIGGHGDNTISPGVVGATIGGGGALLDPSLGRCSADPGIFCAHDEDCSPDYGTCVPDASVGRCSADPATLCVIDDDCLPDGGTCVVPWPLENRITAEYGTIGGGVGNTVGGEGGARSGTGWWSTIAGGYGNVASHWSSTVGGGYYNKAEEYAAKVAGGKQNKATDKYASVGGGQENQAAAEKARVGGGYKNKASAHSATVAGGYQNEATASRAAVAGGYQNKATGQRAAVGGGYKNEATGLSATVPGGHLNKAQGNYSRAAGLRAKALHNGSSVWADSTAADFSSTAANQFLIRASGGVGIGTNSPGAMLDISGESGEAIRTTNTSTSGRWIEMLYHGSVGPLLRAGDGYPRLTIDAKSGGGAGEIRLGLGGDIVGINRVPTTYHLEVDGNAGKTVGGSSWVVISDRRVKEHVKTISDALNKLDKVRLVSFEYSDEYKAAHPDAEDRRHFNVVAQEFAEIFPDHVKPMKGILPNGGEALAVDIHPLTIYSAAAVQELHVMANQQKEEISRLRASLKEIEAMLAASSTTRKGGQP